MKTSTIGYRVADFLRRHPPFQYIEETRLLELVQGGRVQFHEDGEIVFQQGQRSRGFVYVIQQGVVRLVEESESGDTLRDVRGEGDMLGVTLLLGNEGHRYTARTETDVILYALPIAQFQALLGEHPRVARFLQAYFTVSTGTSMLEGQSARSEELRLGSRPMDWMERLGADRTDYPTCSMDMAARDVARMLARTGSGAAAVVGPHGFPMGIVTRRVLSNLIASGKMPAYTPARKLMLDLVPVAQTGLEAGEYLLRMINARCDFVLLTVDGTLGSRYLGLVSRRDITRVEGAAPLSIVEDMARAPNVSTLRHLRLQGEAVLAAGLIGPDTLRWLGPMAAAFNAAVLQRVVALVEQAMEEELTLPHPGLRHCWIFFGGAGRGELLTRHDLDHGIIYEDPQEGKAREARAYFLELGRRVSAGLGACGFVTTAKAIVAGHPSACRSSREWRRAFSTWIRDPVMSSAYRATSFFDLLPICGDCTLVEDLVDHIHAEEAECPNFAPLLANDSMENLPPLTFFQGLVVDDEGTYVEVLDLQRSALQPIVDIARALALDVGCHDIATLPRLAGALAASGDQMTLLNEAAAVFRIALYHRARNGFANESDGHRVDPAKLTRFEQNLLKNGFRTVLQLMEHAAGRYGLTTGR